MNYTCFCCCCFKPGDKIYPRDENGKWLYHKTNLCATWEVSSSGPLILKDSIFQLWSDYSCLMYVEVQPLCSHSKLQRLGTASDEYSASFQWLSPPRWQLKIWRVELCWRASRQLGFLVPGALYLRVHILTPDLAGAD